MKISSRERREKHTERKKKRELNRNKCVKVIDRVKIWREKKARVCTSQRARTRDLRCYSRSSIPLGYGSCCFERNPHVFMAVPKFSATGRGNISASGRFLPAFSGMWRNKSANFRIRVEIRVRTLSRVIRTRWISWAQFRSPQRSIKCPNRQ